MNTLKLFFLLILVSLATSLYSKEKLILNTGLSYPFSSPKQNGFVDIIVNEALARIGYEMESVYIPAERALINANKGIDDGDLLRISGLQEIYPNLIQVPEKIIDFKFVAFTRIKNLTLQNWSSLDHYSVAYITGWKIFEHNITNPTSITKVKNVEQLYTLLIKNRTLLIVFEKRAGLDYINKNHLTDIYIVNPPLATRSMYLYLHKKHSMLVSKLTQALKDIKKNGLYKQKFNGSIIPISSKKIK